MSQREPTNQPKVVVYAGPTICADDVHAVLPQAQVLPPAARGDLLAVDWNAGDIAVVIDGYFREQRSVGHKEILWLLSVGVDVVGAASMGALRAAELAPCGMRGLGTVYGMYASHEIDGDDEVGVLHGPAAVGYPARTVALVNLRYAARVAAHTGLVPAAAGQRVVAAAKALPFTFRTWQDIGRELSGDDRAMLPTMARMIDSGEADVKRLDAMAAVREVGHRGYAAPGRAATAVTWTGIGRNQLLARRTKREYAPGRSMSDLDVLDAARLFDDDYPRVHEEVLTGLLTDLADSRGLSVAQFARTTLGLDDDDELPGNLASWLTETELAGLRGAERLRLVMVRVWPVWQSVDWRPAALARLRESDRWPEWSDLVARADQAAEQARYRLVVPPPAIRSRVFLRRWQQRGSSVEVEMARRGFAGLGELGGTLGRFFVYDVQRGRGPATRPAV